MIFYVGRLCRQPVIKLLVFKAVFLVLPSLSLAATIAEPVRDGGKLLSPVSTEIVKLSNAQVVLADYELLKKDFPALSGKSDQEIDRWLLDNVGYVAKTQAKQSVVNTDIPVTGESAKALRPEDYGRALVFKDQSPDDSTTQIGLIDVKGAGAKKPKKGHHSNGLSTLGEAVREFTYENMVRDVLEDSGEGYHTVGSYAVIDPGFDVVHDDGSRSRAGFYLRQAHRRNHVEYLEESKSIKLAKTFMKYGIDVDGNIQATTGNEIMDFGHYVVVRELGADGYADKRIPFSVWGIDESVQAAEDVRWFHAKHERPWYYAHELADAWASGRATRDAFFQHYKNMLAPVKRALKRDSCAAALMNLVQ